MKNPVINLIKSGSLTVLLLALGWATPAFAGNKPAPGQSHAFGKTLAQWQDAYVRWLLGKSTVPTDSHGNAVLGHVVLLPIPNVPGDGTPGHLNLTLSAGEAFTVPLFFLLGRSYTDSTPPDPLVDPSFFQTANLAFQVDGVTVLDDSNLADYFLEFFFAPPIPINSPPIASVIWFEGVAIVHSPLSVGTHTLKLDLKAQGGFPEFHNTFTLTVVP